MAKNVTNPVARAEPTVTIDRRPMINASRVVRRRPSASRPAGMTRITPASAAAVGMAPAAVSEKPRSSCRAGKAPATSVDSMRSTKATSAHTPVIYHPTGARDVGSMRRGGRPSNATTSTVRSTTGVGCRPSVLSSGTAFH